MTTHRRLKSDNVVMSTTPTTVLPLVTLLATVCPALADIEMPSVFSDHMVVQRDLPISVWGTATAGNRLTINLSTNDDELPGISEEVNLRVDAEGRWIWEMTPISRTDRSWTLEVREFQGPAGRDQEVSSVTIDDILVGEVWLCGGQSNMEWNLDQVGTTDAQKARMDRPTMRLIKAPHVLATEPQDDITAEWEVCSPGTVGDWSAVGYHFGAMLQDELDVPIGLISSNWGGTRIEPWIERADLAARPRFAARVAELQKGIDAHDRMDDATRRRLADEANRDFEARAKGYWREVLAGDPGMENRWMAVDTDDSGWSTMDLPGNWEDREPSLKNYDGTVWFRRTVQVPADWAGKELVLELGRIDDSDRTWFEGTLVGSTTNRHDGARSYTITPRLVDAGDAQITVCVLDPQGGGGFSGGTMELRRADGTGPSVTLEGGWRWHGGSATSKSGPRRSAGPVNPGMNPQAAGTLHDAMIAPFVPYTLRGAIWYQGESNAGQPDEYRELMPLLIESWREDFGSHLAFGIVQLAAFKAISDDPVEGDWAFLRDAQLEAARTVPNTGIAITTDVGNATDIHPKNKKAVGDRLAGWALHDVYGMDEAIPSSPIHSGTSIDGDGIVLTFDHAQGGLTNSDGGVELDGFAIAGEDGVFTWAEARVVGPDSVRVWSKDVAEPRMVRFGWQNNPVRANLVGGTGLPASPFRTDGP
jgi:sialate O-acetylesterase